jgi:hypothetical protein
MIHPRLSDAIVNLRHGAQISVRNNDFDRVEIHDDTVLPSVDEMQAELDRLDAAYTASAYRRARAAAYSEIGDQLDVIWKWMEAEGLVPDTSDSRDLNTAAGMLGAVKAVKAANPKGD